MAEKDKKYHTIHGRQFEIVERYRDERGQQWIVVKSPLFPDPRPGAKQPEPGRFLRRHVPDPDASQPRAGRRGVTKLEV